MTNRTTTLISFADSKYKQSLARLRDSLKSFPIDNIIFYSERDLSPSFLQLIRPQLYRRGYGYWRWKPFLVEQTLRNMEEGSILIYSDSGNFWNPSGVKRFKEYLQLLTPERPILTFQEPFLEKDWNKGDALKALKVYDNEEICMSFQLWGGAFFMLKCEQTMQLAVHWKQLCETKGDLFTDRKSKAPNLLGFREHRHDQSIFSILVKQTPHTEISWQETQGLTGGKDKAVKGPIQCKKLIRHELRLRQKLLKTVLFPYLRLQGMYLVHVKQFHFARTPKWW